jgi:uncharacterized protein YqeY
MSLKDEIQAGLKQAMLNKEEVARDTLRMLKSEMGAEEARSGRELSDAEELQILKRAVKSRRDSIVSYEEGGREQAAERERLEIKVVERFLPQQLSSDEMRVAMTGIVQELGLEGKRDMGRLMKELMSRYAGQVDGKAASSIAGQLLS